jgi:hypothetical protein
VRKECIGARVKRVYDAPKTPCERLLQSGQLSSEKQQYLLSLRERHHPEHLMKEIYREIQKLRTTTLGTIFSEAMRLLV